MTNGSGPTQPPGPRPHILSNIADQSARIVRLPDALVDVARAQRLEGEVVQQNQDGSTRVRTTQGEIDVQLRGRQPQPGQILEIDVPAGRPPRQVTIRPAAPPPAQDVQTPARPAPTTPPIVTPDTNAPIRTRPAAPPVSAPQTPVTAPPALATPRPSIQPAPLPPQSAAPIPQTPAPLPPGTTVRLLPVTPAQAQQIVQATAQSLISLPTQVARLAFTAGLIAQNAQDATAQPALQVKAPAIAALSSAIGKLPVTGAPPGAQGPAGASPLQSLLLNIPSPSAAAIQGTAVTGPALSIQMIPAQALSALPGWITTLPGAEGLTTPSAFARITQLDVRVLNIQPPQITLSDGKMQGLPVPGAIKLPGAAGLPNAAAGTLTAQVTGITAQNLPLITLQWPGSALPQSFVLQFNAAGLPVGSQITLQPQSITIAQPGAIKPGATTLTPGMNSLPQSLLSLFGPGPWPVMDEAYQTLLQFSPQAAQALARSLPSPANSGQLGSAALLFIAAVRSGDIGSWLGDRKVDILQRAGKNNLLGRLTQDLSTLAQRTADAPTATQDWRAVPLPLFWEGEIHKIALYVKDDGGKNSDEKEKTGQTRFIFDLDLNRMGGVQLDGLVREQRLDLVVRTQTPLSASMQQAMRHSYSQALQDTDLHGDLSFQGDIKNWVNVLQQDSQFGASA